MESTGKKQSKLVTSCKELAAASYKCLENNATEGQTICKAHFDAYKECRKAEHTAIIEERRKSGASLN